jgi:hypothetical protein
MHSVWCLALYHFSCHCASCATSMSTSKLTNQLVQRWWAWTCVRLHLAYCPFTCHSCWHKNWYTHFCGILFCSDICFLFSRPVSCGSEWFCCLRLVTVESFQKVPTANFWNVIILLVQIHNNLMNSM